jgi:hypothetical protein
MLLVHTYISFSFTGSVLSLYLPLRLGLPVGGVFVLGGVVGAMLSTWWLEFVCALLF